MKKTIILLTALTLLLVLTGCGGGKSNNNSSNKTGNNTNITISDNCAGGGEIKHGYQLPPCPDPVENAKTLLGIDTNSNGVRDDVEIWIYHNYDTHKNCTVTEERVTRLHEDRNITYGVVHRNCTDEDIPYHQIVREIAMQWARASQIVIQEPKKARENKKYEDNALDCESYFAHFANENNEPILIKSYNFYKELDNIQFNTIKRARAYSEYNFYLSGGVYPSRLFGDIRSKCDFDVDTLLGE
jgi:hypothetical protein